VNRAPRLDELRRPGNDQNHEENGGEDGGAGLQRQWPGVLQELLTDEHGGHGQGRYDDAGCGQKMRRAAVQVVQDSGAALPDEERDPGGERWADRNRSLVRPRRS
jgi:hypothetical protein